MPQKRLKTVHFEKAAIEATPINSQAAVDTEVSVSHKSAPAASVGSLSKVDSTHLHVVPYTRKDEEKADSESSSTRNSILATEVTMSFLGLHINYEPRKQLNSYLPSSLMMDYVVHCINYALVDNYYFKRRAPDYHPYIIRLYYGIIFWIQCLRAGHAASALNYGHHQFLTEFLELFPPSSLPIAGPLIPLFKTISCSQPEIPNLNKVYPRLPAYPGPERRNMFFTNDLSWSFLPNVPGIFGLLTHLNSLINGQEPRYPRKEAHIPVNHNDAEPAVFGQHTFPVPANRTAGESWALISSGLQYPCEADARLNEAFAERYTHFRLPTITANDDLRSMAGFLSMTRSTSWFTHIKTVATTAARFFEGSGTLADCNPNQYASNQIVVKMMTPKVLPTQPTKLADEAALFPFSYRLSSGARHLTTIEEAMAGMAQTNIQMFSTHPHLAGLNATTLQGEFWDIRPTELSPINRASYEAMNDIIVKMMKDRV